MSATDSALPAARAAVARAVKAGDGEAEMLARAELVTIRLARELTSARSAGVILSAGQRAELLGLLDAVTPAGCRHHHPAGAPTMTFSDRRPGDGQ